MRPWGGGTPVPRAAWRVAVLAGMASYLDAGAIVTNGTVLVLYQARFGLGARQIGELSALMTSLFAVGALLGGWLGDRFGRRCVFSTTMLGLLLGTLLLAWAPGPWALYAGTAVVGLCIGADMPVSMAMIAEEAPPGAKGRLVAFSHLLWMGGIIAVLLLQALLGGLGMLGGRLMWLHLSAVCLVVLVLRARLPESRAWQAASRSAGAPSAGQALAQLFSAPWRKSLLALACFYALVNLAANTSGQFKTLIFTSLGGFTVSQTGLLGLALLGVAFASTLGFMRLVDGPHRMRWFALGGVLYAGAQTLPLLLGFNGVTLVACALLSGVGGAVAGEPMWKIWSQELFPTMLRATAQGLTTFVTRMVAAAAALVTPALLQAGPGYLYGSFALAIVLTTALGLAVIARLPKAAA